MVIRKHSIKHRVYSEVNNDEKCSVNVLSNDYFVLAVTREGKHQWEKIDYF